MERRRWEEREKEMGEKVVQEQEVAQMKNLDKGERNNRYSRGLIEVQIHITNGGDEHCGILKSEGMH